LKAALKELEPFVKDGQHLSTGKPFKNFGGMRSRELLGNWLIGATIEAADGRSFVIASDPTGGDGILVDSSNGRTFLTEHVFIPRQESGTDTAEALILKAVNDKREKGGIEYARGKTLVVFLDASCGEWHPNKVAKDLADPLFFEAVWVVCFQKIDGEDYIEGVIHLDLSRGAVPMFNMRIAGDFKSWKVSRTQ
jgi:hypothetical protein